ncbi:MULTISPECIES: hybrid histidine kinase/response regulator HrmK [Cylindrospermopsis]|jgi:signal transduction histidine kinase/ActR/RegA family two-component response regulator|uniref:hybrid histidine kinase/response regulator HrmK n=1 Tax=Cylindrospermopsis TaxID=77021 RepID=UPI00070ABA26|nr:MULTISPECIES: hybrid histidine kinase/response regulator HrmK [Cylindrospermopsis]KRH97110.1 two-component system sensor histidine kinase/response regulator [Cylindrospermopsis sp. CR12]TPX27493.1 response regulator [Cylindrospermopsis raciborskii GIHE 2018]UJL33930.1 response regulator [Cylindrospermopsis raciborskii Cr2010]UJS05797.1 hybrid histidine kinase/response regulator HrmK [Cylindrospermopsis raciborskii KLL07]
MYKYSNLPKGNPRIDKTPKLLRTIQQQGYDLWLEKHLNRLQLSLNFCLFTAVNTPLSTGEPNTQEAKIAESQILQTLLNEVYAALNFNGLGLEGITLYIAECEPQENMARIVLMCNSPTSPPSLSQTTSRWNLESHIGLPDLLEMEKHNPPLAWRFPDDSTNVTKWLIALHPLSDLSGLAKPQFSPLHWRSQFIQKAIKYSWTYLIQTQKIQTLKYSYQSLLQFNYNLERKNKLKNQFLANTSHEIRTPLTSIIGFTELLLAQGYQAERERHQEYLQIIQSSGKHLLSLINDILDLSKIEANQLEVQWEVADIPSLCKSVLALVKEKAGDKGLKLQLEINEDVNTLLVDPLRLKQMLLNLLFNAIKFTNVGSVGLRVVLKDSWLRFTVWDTGVGISGEDLSLLFRPYTQLVNTINTQQNHGTGLGLIVTKQLAEIHGGSIEVRSQLNQGSEFTIILPLKSERTTQILEIQPEQDPELIDKTLDHLINTPTNIQKINHCTILLVENDLNNSELIKTYLNRLGYQVIHVKTATEMWVNLPQVQPTIILMDLKLPDGNGLNLVSEIRKDPRYQNIPIIAQTAMAMKGDREICLASGFTHYIPKPINLTNLGAILEKCQNS